MKKFAYICAALLTITACKPTETEDSNVSAVKGSGLFKNGYLFSIAAPDSPEDQCWYYNSTRKTHSTAAMKLKKI